VRLTSWRLEQVAEAAYLLVAWKQGENMPPSEILPAFLLFPWVSSLLDGGIQIQGRSSPFFNPVISQSNQGDRQG
jgi:hypothetical protein